jgi:hypothetical protein
MWNHRLTQENQPQIVSTTIDIRKYSHMVLINLDTTFARASNVYQRCLTVVRAWLVMENCGESLAKYKCGVIRVDNLPPGKPLLARIHHIQGEFQDPKTVEQLALADRIGAFESMPMRPRRMDAPPP